MTTFAANYEKPIGRMINETIKLTPTSGLVLEGGGMRGVFTCGVLDNLMERGIRFPYTIGVSAGACNGLSYMSGQKGRAKNANINLLDQYHYISLKNLLLKGNIMDFDLMFRTFPEEIIPYDYKAYEQCTEIFEMVTTCCHTGEARYYNEKHDPKRIIEIVRASSSLPFVCPIAYVDGGPMMDGGVADSIPLLRARELGYDNNVVVLTRNKGYRKPTKKTTVPFFMYRKYPALRKAIAERNALYNRQISLVEKLEEEGKIKVIRPERPIVGGRMERDTGKLLDLYNESYEYASKIVFEPVAK